MTNTNNIVLNNATFQIHRVFSGNNTVSELVESRLLSTKNIKSFLTEQNANSIMNEMCSVLPKEVS